MTISRRIFQPLLLLIFITLFTSTIAFAGDDWKPIDPTHLTMKTPMVEKDADAEAIFWEVKVADEFQGYGEAQTVFTHYLRIKSLPSGAKKRKVQLICLIGARRGLPTFRDARLNRTAAFWS